MKKTDGVVLLHGLGRTSGSMQLLAWRLRRAGLRTHCIRYASFRHDLLVISESVRPKVDAFAADVSGDVHFVTHSLGGLVTRTLLAQSRPERLGRVVMLAPPNGGSEWVDLLERWRLARYAIGPTRSHLATLRTADAETCFGTVDYPLGVIAGDRPIDRLIAPWLMRGPHDGKVSVASTRVAGMTDHIVMPVSHPEMPFHPHVARQVTAFLRHGLFDAT